MGNFILPILQSLLILLLAPFVSGLIKKLKAILQNRQGASVVQPYWDLLKNFKKEEVISDTTSWIFRAVPLISFSATWLAAMLVPIIFIHPSNSAGDLIALVYLLAIPRFFMALGGLDAGSAFGGMGSSREMMISSLTEPALILSLFTMAIGANTTDAFGIAAMVVEKGWLINGPSAALAVVALFLVMLAECARLPVDNPETHLELTMVHEAMLLEYSGRSLALLEWSSMMKLTLFMTLLLNLFFPWGIAQEMTLASLSLGLCVYILKLLILSLVLVLIETSTAKLRLFRVPDFLGIAFVLSLLALLSQGIMRLGL